ncbi:amidohydrolase family protein [[Mycobacterium] crassicus]|uniref:Amidohydrolase family protein n=1 Tax=[Mycobacterium] crassicus TaxID=2872309 RepID=A0ABU5XLI8_9MYCO|nr:amidohydrolase family protein [Mycolicibacter sp. MYC098]MEB3023145.1 amidohydrolase family protein [Mycolicibacter sp. MYC098]
MGAGDFLVHDVRLFDGDDVADRTSVLVRDGSIAAVGPDLPAADLSDQQRIDGSGKTLLPGLIDAHTHPRSPALELAILFGVTTELDMFTDPERIGDQREQARTRDDVADIRSASTGATVLGGHPSMLIGLSFREQFPVVSTAADAADFVEARIAEGADFIKLLIDDGTAIGHASPSLTQDMAAAIVDEAHKHALLAVAHATSRDGAAQAVAAGVDGLVHMFIDRPADDEIIEQIVQSGVFVVPTLCTMGSMAGDITGEAVAHDPRTEGLIPADWRNNMCQCWQFGSPSSLANASQATGRLHEAGVRILAGTDAADVGVLGTAHGASLHAELDLLVAAGLSPVDALRAATSVPADSFGLTDRGRVRQGLQADLVLIDGDPTASITDSLSIAAVWRRGSLLDRTALAAKVGA